MASRDPTALWRFIYVSPGAAECLGVFKHTNEEEARQEGRAFARRALRENRKRPR